MTLATSKGRFWLVLALGFTLLFTAGCGLGQKASQKAAEKAAGGLLSAITGEKVTMEGLGDGGKITITGEDGESIDLGIGSGEVPDDFILPVYRGWTTDGFVTTTISEGKTWMGSFQFSDDLNATADRYAKDLEAMGFEVETVTVQIGAGDEFSRSLSFEGTVRGQRYSGWMNFLKLDDTNMANITLGEVYDDD